MNKLNILAIVVAAAIIVAIAASLNHTALFGLTQNEKINIGAILPLSGANASLGEAELQGIQLAIEEENNSQIQLLIEDNQGDSTQSVNAAKALLEQKTIAIFSGLTTPTIPILPILKDKNVILMIEGSIHPELAKESKYFFKDYADALDWAQLLSNAVKEKQYKKTALIVFQTQQGELFSNEVQKTINPTMIEFYDQKTQEFKTILLKIKESGTDSIIFAGLPKNNYAMLKEMEETELLLPTFIINGEWPEVTANGVGNKLQPYTPGFIHFESVEHKAFAEKFKAKYGKEPKIDSAISYDDTKILLKAINQCGANAECIQKEILMVKYNGASGEITFDENRNSTRKSILLQYKEGKWTEAN